VTSPTPIDGLVWSYHQLGWSTRRIADEVHTSQASVVRILDRMKKDPPAGENTVIMTTTPPSGIPALLPPAYDDDEPIIPRPRQRPGAVALLTILTLILIGARAATLAAANGGLIARGKTGPAGPQGPPGPAAPQRAFTVCVRYSTYSGAIVSMTAPVKGKCGTATMIRIP